MTIKTYPLRFTSDKLTEIKIAAAKKEITIKQFIEDAIETELKKLKDGVK